MWVQVAPLSREIIVHMALGYAIRFDGNGLSGTCACTTIAPLDVQKSDGCNPRGMITCSTPQSSRSLPSASTISGAFGDASTGVLVGASLIGAAGFSEAA